MSKKRSILFVCLGNICRSPTAETLFRHFVHEEDLADKWTIDSAAMADYWIGHPAEDRTLDVLQKHNLTCDHIVRQISKADFAQFDYIVAMDNDNMSGLESLKPAKTQCQLLMLGDYDPQGKKIVKDPYFGNRSGFDTMYDHCHRCCKGLLEFLS